ncbi:TetR family transcriptional regulator [Paenibacillus elgii]|uniref:TetR family transcriptional regulator n=1 Tax=Paenibacillus elgii TaxID=189691 RepID=A0A2T6G3S8_9BACL|nr:TetR/AcrR family transcriptional regulator [Paenibacillus elgii]PUA38803.1 TetR family transcriptional regulator [Paenibacillus elgii]
MLPESNEDWIEQLLKLSDEEPKMTEKQTKILHAAIEIFAEKGYAAASTSEIAQKAGVAEGTIFRHYKTKKDLLLSIVLPIMAKLVAPFVLRNFTPVLKAKYTRYEDFLRSLIRNRLEFARQHLPMIKILMQEIPFHPDLQEQFKTEVMNEVLTRIKKVIVFFQQEGQIIPLPAATVVRLTASVIIGFLITRFLLVPEQEWDEEEEAETCIRFIMHGLATR